LESQLQHNKLERMMSIILNINEKIQILEILNGLMICRLDLKVISQCIQIRLLTQRTLQAGKRKKEGNYLKNLEQIKQIVIVVQHQLGKTVQFSENYFYF